MNQKYDYKNYYYSTLMTGVPSDLVNKNYVRIGEDTFLEAFKDWQNKHNHEQKFKIKKVIFNMPATIVYWEDGEKTVVKAHNEPFDREKGLAMAITKKVLGNKGNFNDVFREWIQ